MGLGPIGGELEGHGRSDMGLGPMAGSWRVMEEATWGWGLWRGVGGSWKKRHGAGAYGGELEGHGRSDMGLGLGQWCAGSWLLAPWPWVRVLVPLSFMSSAVRWGIEDLLLRVVMRIKQGNLCQGFFDQYLTQSKSSEQKSGGVVIKS